MHDSTIIAPATPLLPCARAAVRLSGAEAFALAKQIFSSATPLDAGMRARIRGSLALSSGACPAELWNFPPPASATGEHCVELHLPGSPALVREAIDALCSHGAQLAEAGDFTKRAFLAGRMDLAQAEAVMALVSSAGAHAARRASDVLRGGVSAKLDAMIERLEMLCASFEVSFDFDEEAAEQADEERFGEQARATLKMLETLAGPVARKRSEEPRVVIAGPANAGKSTLFNALLGEERAAVSAEAGATRDLVAATTECAGVQVELVDSAGFKAARDVIEGQSLERTRAAAQGADAVLWLLASSGESLAALEREYTELTSADPELAACSLLVRTKLDQQPQPSALPDALAALPCISISALRGQGVAEVRAALAAHLRQLAAPEAPALSARAYALMDSARACLSEAVEALEVGAGLEIVSSLARSALSDLRDLAGRGPSADVLDTVFGNFCIGK